MKKLLVICVLLSFVLSACGAVSPMTPIVIIVTATDVPTQEQIVPTQVVVPTKVPTPVDTITPVTVAMVDQALLHDGYNRYPLSTKGKTGFSYVKENAWEPIYLYDDGYLVLEILTGSTTPESRNQHLEYKFAVLGNIFPANFMQELRKESDTYNQTIPSSISSIVSDKSKCPNSNNYNDDWHTINIECNVKNTTISSVQVAFSLWFYQVTCPSQYSFCYFNGFPGQEFSGQSSFTFYDIGIWFIPDKSTHSGG